MAPSEFRLLEWKQIAEEQFGMLDRLLPECDVRINSGISDLSTEEITSKTKILSNERPRKSKHAYSQNLTTGMAIIVRLILPRILPQGFKILQIPISPEKMGKEYVFDSTRAHMTDSILLPRPSTVNSAKTFHVVLPHLYDDVLYV